MAMLIAAVFTLAALVNPAPTALPPLSIDPWIIEGEAGVAGCPLEGLVAVAWVNYNHYQKTGRTPAWYGHKPPSAAAYHIARYWHLYEDPTGGAVHLFSKQDTKKQKVKKLIGWSVPRFEVECAANLGLKGY